MKLRTAILSGAGMSLAFALAAASPTLAQDFGQSPQYSTPEEQARTQQLNQQYANGTTQSPDELNGESGSGPRTLQTEPAQYSGDQDTPVGGPQQYDDQQQQYQDQQQQYQDQRQRYQDQRDEYRAQQQQYVHDLRRYDLARYEWTDYPRVYVYHYNGDAQLHRLYLLADPTHQLAQVPIEGPSGRFIGKVRNVETAPDGRPNRIEVSLNRVVSVWVTPGHFRYDPDDRVLFTDLTRDDLWGMPPATVESGTYQP